MAYQGSVKDIYLPLPSSTRDVVVGQNSTQKEEQNVIGFIRNLLPSNKVEDFNDYLNKPFAMVPMRQRSKQKCPKKNLISLKERRQLGLYKLRRKEMKYDDFLPLHNLWKAYFVDYLDLNSLEMQRFKGNPEGKHWENLSRKLLKGDYHGAILTVKSSICCSLVGKKGIVVFDTKNTFQLLGEDNVLRIIPKESSIFTLKFHHFIFTILGNQFCIKPSARVTKKMKTYISMDL